MFSVDWPYESNKNALDFRRRVPLSPPDLDKFAHGNAERILKLGN
jgi:predicted TIM-barrel fold metal-dependent hydrolase